MWLMALGRGNRRVRDLLLGVRRYSEEAAGDTPGQKPKKRVPLSQRDGEWYSQLRAFAPETPRRTVLRLFQVPLDWSPGSLTRWWRRQKQEASVFDQRYISERHQVLGSNLATAHFVVARGGAVRFRGRDDWVRKKDGEDEYDLPRQYVPGMMLEAVDIGSMPLLYEGLENFSNLQQLSWLKLAGNPHVDDWFLDRASNMFQDTVQYLDISDCTNVSERGLCALYRMNALRTLKVGGPATSSMDFQLACLLLEEAHPNLHVEGITYISLPEGSEENSQT